MQNLVILGSTGSIGISTLAVVRLHLDKYKVYAISGFSQTERLFEQCVEFKPNYAILPDNNRAKDLANKLKMHDINTIVLNSEESLTQIVKHSEVDIVMSAIIGFKGLLPTYAAIEANKKVLLANKESLVAAGKIIMQLLLNSKAQLIPVDSEHNAIFQCMEDNNKIHKIILTASGGPFRLFSKDQLAKATLCDALKHPNWIMGQKITIDSSTLMNKGLELIEAYWLFGQNIDLIDIVIHPQSIIHSMVQYIDGSIIAQMSVPNMQTPIAHALAYPKRIYSGNSFLDFSKIVNFTFEQPDYNRFPCLSLAIDAITIGQTMPAILNSANEIAVEAFLQQKISFYQINQIIEKAMHHFAIYEYTTIEEIIQIDLATREYVKSIIN